MLFNLEPFKKMKASQQTRELFRAPLTNGHGSGISCHQMQMLGMEEGTLISSLKGKQDQEVSGHIVDPEAPGLAGVGSSAPHPPFRTRVWPCNVCLTSSPTMLHLVQE